MKPASGPQAEALAAVSTALFGLLVHEDIATLAKRAGSSAEDGTVRRLEQQMANDATLCREIAAR